MAAELITDDRLEGVDQESASTPAPKRKRRASPKKKKSSSGAKAKSGSKGEGSASSISARQAQLGRELGGLGLVALALGLFLAIVSFEPADLEAGAGVANWIGPVGARAGDLMLTLFGFGAFGLDGLLWYAGALALLGRPVVWRGPIAGGMALFLLSSTMLSHLALAGRALLGRPSGGVLGEWTAEVTRAFVGTAGAYIIAIALLIASLLLMTRLQLSDASRLIAAKAHELWARLRHRARVWIAYHRALGAERRIARGVATEADVECLARVVAEAERRPLIAADGYAFEEALGAEVAEKFAAKVERELAASNEDLELSGPTLTEREGGAPPRLALAAPPEDEAWTMGEGAPDAGGEPTWPGSSDAERVSGGDQGEALFEGDGPGEVTIEVSEGGEALALGSSGDFGPRIIEQRASARAEKIKQLLSTDEEGGVLFKPAERAGGFELPKISFLNYEDAGEKKVDIDQLRAMAAQIEKTLRDFKVDGQVRDICPGPVITVFEFSPAPGVKLSKIANLSDDLAMALSALSVRIVAPIPGRGVVGIEVPNPTREIVYMKEVVADKVFFDDQKMALPMGLGKDTAGEPIVTDLAKMPHLLVAGATGSGKSVAVNTMITSLLYKNTPDDVRLIMVDPKMLEFSIYADIPHLLLPVVTDPKQATVALNWAVNEMEQRYQRLADLNVRNIKGYNKKVAKLTKQATEDMERGVEESEAIGALGIDADGAPEHRHLPYIVVIIDEFADLMMTASKDVETAVARLAQKARAAGLHLILATQRPSTDVITGLIKANFPTRIALRVTSKTDSRVILDGNGAENLLGNGDMLFVPPGTSHVQRVHGAYVSEDEIEKLVAHLKTQGAPDYNTAILEADEEQESLIEESERDEHYEDAVRLVVESRQASISMIQRKLRVGYNRAARMVEHMEIEGYVSAPDGCKPREVLIDASPF